MSTDAPLIEAPRKNRLPLIIGGVLALALVAGLIYALVGKDDDKGTTTVSIGVIGGSDPYWEPFKKAAADEGIEVELVDFTEYTQPNPALTDGRDSTSTSSSTSSTSPTTTWPTSDDLHADRLHRDLPAGAVLHEVRRGRGHPRRRHRRGPQRPEQPRPRPAGAAVGRA